VGPDRLAGGFKQELQPQTNRRHPKIQESIEFERGYVGFMTAVGMIQAGFMSSGKWGTDFGDDEQSDRAR
jgi:hypothetical protein